MPERRDPFLVEEYLARIDRVVDFIEAHYGEALTLAELAGVAGFSAFHFHRIFSTYTGEALFQYLQRLRLEKAAFYLLAERRRTVADIALACGFSDQAVFARAFKRHFGLTARQLRSGERVEDSKQSKIERKQAQDSNELVLYNQIRCLPERSRQALETLDPLEVTVKELAPFEVVYVRHVGPYKQDPALFKDLFDKLGRWAAARDLGSAPGTRWLTLYHNNPDLTAREKLRISVCMSAPPDTPVSGPVGRLTVAGGKYGVGRFRLGPLEYQGAWNYLFARWLPESGYQPDERLCFELYPGGEGLVEIYIPIKPL